MIYSLFLFLPFLILVPFLFENGIQRFIIRYCNGFFFNKFFIENEVEIKSIIDTCEKLYLESKQSNEIAPVKLTLENSHFFSYYKIQDASDYNVFIGPVYNQMHSEKRNIKPFICYTKKTKNMSIKDVKDRLFYLKLFKDCKEN